MQGKMKVAAMAVALAGLAVSPILAASSSYRIAVEVMGPDGSRRAYETFQCPTHDRCQNWLPLVVDGKPFKMGVRSYLLDDHHMRLILQGNGLAGGPFDEVTADRPFEAGQEWDENLTKTFFTKPPKLFGKAHIRIES